MSIEPSHKRPRLGAYHPTDVELERKRTQNDRRLKSLFENIFDKYGQDFDGIADEIDLETGDIVVNNGHLLNMRHEKDAGDGQEDPVIDTTAAFDGFSDDSDSESTTSSWDDIGPLMGRVFRSRTVNIASSETPETAAFAPEFDGLSADDVSSIDSLTSDPGQDRNTLVDPALMRYDQDVLQSTEIVDPKWIAPPLPGDTNPVRDESRTRQILPLGRYRPPLISPLKLMNWKKDIAHKSRNRLFEAESQSYSSSKHNRQRSPSTAWTDENDRTLQYLKTQTSLDHTDIAKYFPKHSQEVLEKHWAAAGMARKQSSNLIHKERLPTTQAQPSLVHYGSEESHGHIQLGQRLRPSRSLVHVAEYHASHYILSSGPADSLNRRNKSGLARRGSQNSADSPYGPSKAHTATTGQPSYLADMPANSTKRELSRTPSESDCSIIESFDDQVTEQVKVEEDLDSHMPLESDQICKIETLSPARSHLSNIYRHELSEPKAWDNISSPVAIRGGASAGADPFVSDRQNVIESNGVGKKDLLDHVSGTGSPNQLKLSAYRFEITGRPNSPRSASANVIKKDHNLGLTRMGTAHNDELSTMSISEVFRPSGVDPASTETACQHIIGQTTTNQVVVDVPITDLERAVASSSGILGRSTNETSQVDQMRRSSNTPIVTVDEIPDSQPLSTPEHVNIAVISSNAEHRVNTNTAARTPLRPRLSTPAEQVRRESPAMSSAAKPRSSVCTGMTDIARYDDRDKVPGDISQQERSSPRRFSGRAGWTAGLRNRLTPDSASKGANSIKARTELRQSRRALKTASDMSEDELAA